MRISDWSSDVCSSDLLDFPLQGEKAFDPRRRDVVAAAEHDDVLLAVGYLQVAVFVQLADVAGVQPAVPDCLIGGFIAVPLAAHTASPGPQDLALPGDLRLGAHDGPRTGRRHGGTDGVSNCRIRR